ncbi:MAG: 4-(cytidine 5'-diphospho)-2-C-methyl-D-erythritol kinase [Opitutales bacterium]|nr:4-(cytidine 5'-diphospho)-2-C-methyl-D-erythritol kinase [Opitutales bacterium]
MDFQKKVFDRRAPAKINLMLAITGTRDDGFHNLVSLVAPVPALFDVLKMTLRPDAAADSLACAMPGVPLDAANLVLRAAAAFRSRVPAFPFVHFELEKNIPHGAGLGGGSSDAATAILLMAEAAGTLAPCDEVLHAIAAEIGSDCPLFLAGEPIVMRGRGERTEKLSAAEKTSVFSKRFLIFKPAFGVSTAEAYGAMKRAAPAYYTPENLAEEKLSAWRKNPAGTPLPLFNDMERPVFKKHLALPALFEILRERFGLDPHMSGSGSACFAEIDDSTDLPSVRACIRACWGETAFVFS